MALYLASIILLAYAASLLALAWNLWRTVRLVHARPTLPPTHSDPQRWPPLDLLIPVKDEAGHIAACLQSVLAQDYPNLRITVVNDRSTDTTVQAVQAVQARHPEVRRVDIAELPEGLFGKPHALHRVAKDLTGDLVAFVDSDFQLLPHCLPTLVDHLRTNKLDWLAVMGKPELSMFWERLLVPLLGAVTYAWYDPRKIADPNWDDAIGSGFLVVRREAYQAIGGHGAVVRAYDEDSEIMRLAKRAGHRIAYVLAPELFTLRMYGSLKRTIRGITRTFIGGLKTVPRFLITINGLNFVSLLPTGLLAGLGLASWWGVSVLWSRLWMGMAVVHLLASTMLAWMVYSRAGTSRRFAFLHPLGAAMLIGICVRALRELRRGQPITWRGTTY